MYCDAFGPIRRYAVIQDEIIVNQHELRPETSINIQHKTIKQYTQSNSRKFFEERSKSNSDSLLTAISKTFFRLTKSSHKTLEIENKRD